MMTIEDCQMMSRRAFMTIMAAVCFMGMPAVVIALIFPGCTSTDQDTAAEQLEQIEPRVKEVIADPARGDMILAIHQEMSRLTGALDRSNQKTQQELKELHQSASATRADFERVFNAQRKTNRQLMDQLVVLRSKAAELMTDKEWSALISQ